MNHQFKISTWYLANILDSDTDKVNNERQVIFMKNKQSSIGENMFYLRIYPSILRYSTGDTRVPFCLQSCMKPLKYALAIHEFGTKHVHSFVGKEPSGLKFNELSLNEDGEQKKYAFTYYITLVSVNVHFYLFTLITLLYILFYIT